jgi:hypothetical protein
MRKLWKTALAGGVLALALAVSATAYAKAPGGGGTSTTPTAASVKILAPLFGTGVIPFKPFTFIGSITDPYGAALGACTVNWGDGTASGADASAISATTSNCATMHAYSSAGYYSITFAGTDANGFVGTSSAVLMLVIG